MKRFIDPNARPAMSGRYREGQTRDAHTRLPNPELWREQELTPEQKAALESWTQLHPQRPVYDRAETLSLRSDGPEVVFIPEGEA